MSRGQNRSLHHLKCRSNGGGQESSNVVWVSRKKHKAWHLLFGNKDALGIAEECNKLVDPQWYLVARRK